MNYVLINHIPAHAGRDDAHVRLPAAWARDLTSAARAAASSGIRLIVATPRVNAALNADAVELSPDAAGFEHVALPHYQSARSFLHERKDLTAQLATTIRAAHLVQLDLGGHPVPLGLVADPIARAAGKPTLWMLAGESITDPRLARSSRSRTKRMVGRTLGTRVRRSFADALRNAAAVVTTHATAAAQLAGRDDVEARTIESIDVIDSELAAGAEIAARHLSLLDTSRPLRILVAGAQTIDRGTEHVLAAMHRCWRLRVPVTLIADNAGPEADVVQRHAHELGLGWAVKLQASPSIADADLVIDAALTNALRHDLEGFVARGLPSIAYAPRRTAAGVTPIARGAVDALADALFRAATDRAWVASQMIIGHAWARERTLDTAHRRRFALARELTARFERGAA